MKSSSKWLVATLLVVSVAGYWYHQEQACHLLTIHVIRHGLTNANQDGILIGSTDDPLNDTGRQQASVMADKLASSSVRELYSSPKKRACETATIMGTKLHIPVIVDDRLRERTFGKAEGVPVGQLEHFMKEHRDHGVEPLREHVARITDFFKDMAAQHKSEVYIVGHAGMVKSLFDYLDLAPEAKITVPNCSLFTFVYNRCSGHISYQSHQENLDR